MTALAFPHIWVPQPALAPGRSRLAPFRRWRDIVWATAGKAQRGSDGKFKRRSDGKAQDNSSSSSSCCCGTNCGTCASASGSAYSYWTATVSGVTTCSGCYYLGSLWGTGSGDLDGTGNLPFSGGGSGVAEWYASSAYTSAYSVTFYNPTDCSGTGTLRSNLSVGIRFGVCIDANKTISVLAATSTGSLFYGAITPLPGDCSSISSLTFSNLITSLQRHRADLGAGHRIWWHGGFNPSRMISDVSFCHRCVLGNGYACSGGCPCPFDSREIVEHALSSYCPHPDGPRFGTGKKPGRWDELAAIDVSAAPLPRRGLPHPPEDGPGTRLEKRLARRGFLRTEDGFLCPNGAKIQGCACDAMRSRMDRWGEKCAERKSEILAHFRRTLSQCGGKFALLPDVLIWREVKLAIRDWEDGRRAEGGQGSTPSGWIRRQSPAAERTGTSGH